MTRRIFGQTSWRRHTSRSVSTKDLAHALRRDVLREDIFDGKSLKSIHTAMQHIGPRSSMLGRVGECFRASTTDLLLIKTTQSLDPIEKSICKPRYYGLTHDSQEPL